MVASHAVRSSDDQSFAQVTAEPDGGLLKLAQEYSEINDPDYTTRVAMKDQAAAAMLRYVFQKKISKQALQTWDLAQPSDGLTVALASYVLANPEEGDVARLLSVGKFATWLHVKYRITLALRALAKEGFGKASEWKEALTMLSRYSEHARMRGDQSLVLLATEIEHMIQSKLG